MRKFYWTLGIAIVSFSHVAWPQSCLPEEHKNCKNDFVVRSSSMAPILLPGDNFFVDTEYYNRHEPALGDVVVFMMPKDVNIIRILRVLGLPGDKVQVRDGVLHINHYAVPRRGLPDFNLGNAQSGAKSVAQYEETLPNGVTYRVLDLVSQGDADNTPEYEVVNGTYFVMGDNRDNSLDLRYLQDVGFIPSENIFGKATKIYLSWDLFRIGTLIK